MSVEIWIRTLVAFVLIMIVTRILGKQTISQMTFHDFVTAITLGGLTANLSFNLPIKFWNMLTSLLLFSGIAYVLSLLSLKSRHWRKWLSGTPTILIEDGKILENNMKQQRISLDTLVQELREKDVFDIQEVEFAVLELNGRVSVLKKPEYRQVLMKDIPAFAVPAQTRTSFPVELIMDGRLVTENLDQNQIREAWIHQELKKRKLALPEICYAVKGTDGKLYIDTYNDNIQKPIDEE